MAGEQHWPDGNGKRRHPKERGAGHSQVGNDAAVTAVHRTDFGTVRMLKLGEQLHLIAGLSPT